MMGYFSTSISCLGNPFCMQTENVLNTYKFPVWKNSILRNPRGFKLIKSNFRPLSMVKSVNKGENTEYTNEEKEEKPRFRWLKIGSNISEGQKQTIAQIPPKMANRCQALLKQIICFSPENGSISLMMAAWVKSMNPRRADWLSVLKELEKLNHPMYFEV